MGFYGMQDKISRKAAVFKERAEAIIKEMDYKRQMENIDESIEEIYNQIGKIVCRTMEKPEGTGASGIRTKEIEDKYRQIIVLKRKYKEIIRRLNYNSKDVAYCEECGEGIRQGEFYCPLCGKKIR